MAPFSKGVTEAAARGWEPISANFLMPQWVKSHWPKYVEGCERAGRPADSANWRVAKSIFVADDDKTAAAYATDPDSPYRYYYRSLFTKLKKNGRIELFKTRRDMPDEEVTLDMICDKLIIHGSPEKVTDELLAFRDEVGRLRHAALRRQGLARPRARPPLHGADGRDGGPGGRGGDAARQGGGRGMTYVDVPGASSSRASTAPSAPTRPGSSFRTASRPTTACGTRRFRS